MQWTIHIFAISLAFCFHLAVGKFEVRRAFTICTLINGYCGVACGSGRRALNFPIQGFLCPIPSKCCVPRPARLSSKTTPRPYRPRPTTRRPATWRPTTKKPTTLRQTTRPWTPKPTTATPNYTPRCGIGLTPRIYGGTDASMCEFPWMVYLFRDPSPCGASIIDSQHLITAAHCVHKIEKNRLRIIIGEHRRSAWVPSAEFEVKQFRVFVHPKYVPKYYTNDIAIIKLSEEIQWSRYKCLSPICLPERWRRFQSTRCTVTGWGVVSPVVNFLHPPLADVLQKVTVDVVDNRVCSDLFTRDWFKPTNYCAGYLRGGKDSCGGDSGGPLQCQVNGKWVLAGLVSTGSGCGEKGKAAIYTDVAKYRTFIQQIQRIY